MPFKWIIVALALSASFVFADPEDTAANLRALPPAAQQSVRRFLTRGIDLDEVTKTNIDGKLAYQVSLSQGEKSRDLTLAPDGRILEMDVFLEELPHAAQSIVTTLANGAPITSITRTIDDDSGTYVYDIEMTKNNLKRDFTISTNGNLMHIIAYFSELPAPARNAVQSVQGEAKLGEITKNYDHDEITYDVELVKGGKTKDVIVSEEGAVESVQMNLEETPTAIQNAVQSALQGGTLKEIDKQTDEGQTYFTATIANGVKTHQVFISTTGEILPEEP